MTPEAQAFIGHVVQTSRQRFRDPWHLLRLHNYGGSETNKWMLMILGSVLLPEEVGKDFYLDSHEVRSLIQSQLNIHPRNFFNHANISSWGRLSVRQGDATLGRRFYAVNKENPLSWGYTIVYNQGEKDAEDSAVIPEAIVLPDFDSVTDEMRYRAMGA